MKQRILASYLLVIIISSTTVAKSATDAQQPSVIQAAEKEAWELLDNIGGDRAFQATFLYTSQAHQGSTSAPQEGHVAVQEHKYRLDLQDQLIMNCGDTVWTYLKKANEVQIRSNDPEQAATVPWNVLTRYRQEYHCTGMHDQMIENSTCKIIDLQAQDADHVLPRIKLTIDQASNHLQCLEAQDQDETLHIFEIVSFEPDAVFDAAFFQFDPTAHRNVEIIDMR